MENTSVVTIPARRGKAAAVSAGRTVKVINTHGKQVVDTWAFNRELLIEFMSMEHTRTALARIMPKVGDSLVTNQRRPILTVVEDTTLGIHDTMMAACDRYRVPASGLCRVPRQLYRQPGGGPGRAGSHASRDGQPVESFHEHSGAGWRSPGNRTAGLQAGGLCAPAGRNGLHRCILGLSPGYNSKRKWRRRCSHRGPLSGSLTPGSFEGCGGNVGWVGPPEAGTY